ncbi:hypothetical protein HN51_048491 [Arachis hypogaea]
MAAVEQRMVLHRAQQVKKSRHGPRSQSSAYRGVTFYRRIGRCESHICMMDSSLFLEIDTFLNNNSTD